MTTMNMPYSLRDEKSLGEEYRNKVVELMVRSAEELDLPYEVI